MGISVMYQAIGSGSGIQNLYQKIVDFAASDTFLLDDELPHNTRLLHLPIAISLVVCTYNLPEIQNIRLNSNVLFLIYSGEILYWDDPKILFLNPNIFLPHIKITPVYRSDSSGTTHVFSEFMSKSSLDWEIFFGFGKTINWSCGLGQRGNAGVITYVKQNIGSICYADYSYVMQNTLPIVSIKNKDKTYPSVDLNSNKFLKDTKIPQDSRISLIYLPGKSVYPMMAISYLLIYQEQNYNKRSFKHAQNLVKLILWLYSDAIQTKMKKLGFMLLPDEILKLAKKNIKSITYDGVSIQDSLYKRNTDE